MKRTLIAIVGALVATSPAFAADPTYTSVISEQLGSVSVDGIIGDIALFGGMVITLAVTVVGIMFFKNALGKVVKM